jgi:transposase
LAWIQAQHDASSYLGKQPNTVIKWRQRFAQHGLAGLVDAPRPGAKPLYGADFRKWDE